MSSDEILALARTRRHGVQASHGTKGTPQAALVGFALSDGFEIVFDTVKTSRKYEALKRDARAAFVVGGDGDAWTLQLEGVVDEPTGDELARLQDVYFAVFPDGRSRLAWSDIVYLRLRPLWYRFSDFRGAEPVIEEWDAFAGR